MARVSVRPDDFCLAHEQKLISTNRHDIGAIVSFTGLVRDIHGDNLSSLTLEHYPAMTLRELEKIAGDAESRWPLIDLTVIHRYGKLMPGEQIVLVIAASAHREAAFQAASYVMDFLKTRAPFWKKESSATETKWVEAKKADDQATDKW